MYYMYDVQFNLALYYLGTNRFSYLSAFPRLCHVTYKASPMLLNVCVCGEGLFLNLYSITFLLVISNQNLTDQCKWRGAVAS